ncbi:hypothetical protein BU23DRAFT_600895 [Bimuria novae-zelandiae CBS 107.79]|uniref:Clr5 domain-containing protein n=1 Tax=Bimuria novae-zelandiae CBS 107.79 TaxID=1447943 RepID=A0A6A5V0E0_9PLEO|nr:hypothetical protein BU23DRAFT_600895 [Bimuria novae-zelandiae CBS 107.79]
MIVARTDTLVVVLYDTLLLAAEARRAPSICLRPRQTHSSLQYLAAGQFCFLTRLTHEAALTMNFPLRNSPDLAPVDLPQPGFPHAAGHLPAAQQAYGAYSVDRTFGFALQAQFPSEHSAITQPHPPHPFSLCPVLPNDKQHDAEPVGNSQSVFAAPAAPISPMGPPAQLRKRKAPTLHTDAWEPYKHRILELHLTQGLPLLEVGQKIEDEYGFKAKYVAPTNDSKAELVFEVRGSVVLLQKIERWIKRNNVVKSFLYAPNPAILGLSHDNLYTLASSLDLLARDCLLRRAEPADAFPCPVDSL